MLSEFHEVNGYSHNKDTSLVININHEDKSMLMLSQLKLKHCPWTLFTQQPEKEGNVSGCTYLKYVGIFLLLILFVKVLKKINKLSAIF